MSPKITHKSSNYTLCVKLHTECKSTLGLCKNKKYTHITPTTLSNYTLCVKAHSVCVKIQKLQKKSSNYTLCVKLHTECKSTLGLCKNKRHKIWHKVCQITHGM